MDKHNFFLDSDISQKSLNYFTTDADFQNKKTRAIRDAQAHRMIEKRRRDRMNSCLADLGQLIQSSNPEYRQGRIEKTEIIEMAIEYINFLQGQVSARQIGEEDRFVTGFKKCRDETVKFLMSKNGNDSMDSEGMTLVAHLQENLQTLCSGANGSTIVTSTQRSGRYLYKSSAISSVQDIKQEAIESLDGDGDFNVKTLSSGQRSCKLDASNVDADKMSLTSSSSSSSDINKNDSVIDWEFTEERSEQKESNKRREGPTGELRSGRRRSFSECSAPYKFKDNMKVRFRNDSITGNTDTLRSEHKTECRKRPRSECETRVTNYGETTTTTSERLPEVTKQSVPAATSISSLVGDNDYVPAFALYPGSLFYIPVSLSTSQISHVLDMYSTRDLCHPISITVNFSGPRVRGKVLTTGSSQHAPKFVEKM